MYTGEFKNGARYERVGDGVITYIGSLYNTHYYIDIDGSLGESRDDILRNWIDKEIKTPKTIIGYVNIYKDGSTSLHIHPSRKTADNMEKYDNIRTECVKVTITYTEGQFDE